MGVVARFRKWLNFTSLRLSFTGLVLVSIPFVSSAENATPETTTVKQPILSQTGVLAESNILIETNLAMSSFTFEYSVSQASAGNTNSQKTFSLIKTRQRETESDLDRFVRRHMTKDQEYRFVGCEDDSSRLRKALASVSSGYGEFFNEDTASATYRGSNGTCREAPGYLYVRSRFTF